jgi:predicted nucleotide-binding protein
MVSIAGGFRDPQQDLYWARRNISSQMRRLESVRQRLHLFDSEVEEYDMSNSLTKTPIGKKVFIVHGHTGDVKLQVAQFLERITGERPVILHEQADSGRTVIEKFEDHASEAGFAVVLLTADDAGGVKGSTNQKSRARQNVVLEFGFFIGKLGRGRVVALYEDGVELPSDLSGVLYKPLSGNWHTELAKELVAANIEVDLTRLV